MFHVGFRRLASARRHGGGASAAPMLAGAPLSGTTCRRPLRANGEPMIFEGVLSALLADAKPPEPVKPTPQHRNQ